MLFLPLLAAAQPVFCPVAGNEKIKVPCSINFFGVSGGPAGSTTFGAVVARVLSIALLVVGAVSVIYLVYGGFRYITTAGNEERAESAKKAIWHAILGLIIVILSFAIITIITSVLVTGRP